MSRPVEFHTDHNVYILGAGFSMKAGLPSLAGFLQAMRETRVAIGNDQARTREAEAIDAVLRFRQSAAAASERIGIKLDNIEELLGFASAWPPESGNDIMGHDLPIAIATTLAECGQRAPAHLMRIEVPKDGSWVTPGTWKQEDGGLRVITPCYDLYTALMTGFLDRRAGQRNTIITFNYDTLVECALSHLPLNFTYGFGDPNQGATCRIGLEKPKTLPVRWNDETQDDGLHLLKLHGSINWGVPEPRDDHEILRTVYDDYSGILADNRWPLLEPPMWNKRFPDLLRVVWNKAVERLRTATRVIIIGYSCPPADQHFRFLLAAGLHRNISLTQLLIVNPDEAVHARIGEMVQNVPIIPIGNAENLFLNPGYLQAIGRRPQCWTSPPM